MKVLLIDNYDSFTYNLAQLIARVSGAMPTIIKNDALSADELANLPFDAIVLSPGPGRPESSRDFGICAAAISNGRAPILGVCLGHQGIGHLVGGRVHHAPEPMHGRVSDIHHNAVGLFGNIPSPFKAVRYHSLILSDVPDDIEIQARTADGLIMAIAHRTRPLWGVQFHPESILTEYGDVLIENFMKTAALGASQSQSRRISPSKKAGASPPKRTFKMHCRLIRTPLSPELCHERLFSNAPDSFWLDSSSAGTGQGRFSFMGDASGEASEIIQYDCSNGALTVRSQIGVKILAISVFDYLERAMAETAVIVDPAYPCPLSGGYVGYFGYEMKQECGGSAAHKSDYSDAFFIFAQRFLAFDSETGDVWLVHLTPQHASVNGAKRWFDAIETQITPPLAEQPFEPSSSTPDAAASYPHIFEQRHTRQQYLHCIERALDKIRDGESYEICLTNRWSSQFSGDPARLYRRIRRINPVPYGAFLKFGDLSILSCSPERLLKLSADRDVESKPIKGTIRRGRTAIEDDNLRHLLAASEKDRAENLMIVDLIRNDLNKVCETGSVQVPRLFAIESFATVHQMVSTVTGRLRRDTSAVACVRVMFPGGSMTGAPKIRTMEIIDELEQGPRGVYSGAIGYLSLDGSADLNIVIRTIVIKGTDLSIGAGGAIVWLSDPDNEYEETLLKCEVLRQAVESAGRENNLRAAPTTSLRRTTE